MLQCNEGIAGESRVTRDPFRAWAARYIQTLAFLGAYFILVVAGNLIFASPLGEVSLKATGYRLEVLHFSESFTLGYWTLLLSPFVLTPLIVWTVRRFAGSLVSRLYDNLPDFKLIDFVVIFAICLAFIVYQFWKADVLSLFASGTDAASSVKARFEIRERIGFFTFMPLQALLTFVCFFAIVKAMRDRSILWWLITIASVFVVSALLTMINMKWPVLIFYLGLVATIFVYTSRLAYLKTAIGLAVVCICYVAISMFVFRIAPEPVSLPHTSMETASTENGPQSVNPESQKPQAPIADELSQATAYAETSIGMVPTLAAHALNRMAISYPYYYHIFTEEGAVCGGIMAQAMPDPPCRPSYLVYRTIFPDDGFAKRGTSPMPAHVSGYAYGGWPVAALALVAASVILGLFASIPLDRSVVAGASVATGAVTGYHFSQIPGEGVVFYEQGIFWVALLLLFYFVFCLIRTRWSGFIQKDASDAYS